MSKRFIDSYKVIILDMGNTFMFDCDRFGENEDYYSTYRILGGKELDQVRVTLSINHLYSRMMLDHMDPDCLCKFKTIPEFMQDISMIKDLPDSELFLLEKVFARHEMGQIPDIYVNILFELSKTHKLGLISNIWSDSRFYEMEFKKLGILDIFQARIWSSDNGCQKPSSRLFEKAIDHFKVEAESIVYIGDSPDRDVVGAKSVGMASVWIENNKRCLSENHPKPDLIISDLVDILKS